MYPRYARKVIFASSAAVVAGMMSPSQSVTAQENAARYALFELENLGRDDRPHGLAWSLNDQTFAAGFSFDDSRDYHATAWSGTQVFDLGSLGDIDSEAFDINNSNQIVGSTVPVGGQAFKYHAFLWEDGQMTDLGTLGGSQSEAFAINDQGQIAGWSFGENDASQIAFRWENWQMTALPALPGSSSARAWDINNVGQVAGLSADPTGMRWRAVIWLEDKTIVELGSLGGFEEDESIAYAINDLGQVVGSSEAGCCGDRGFIWEDGKMRQLPFIPGYRDSLPWAINNSSQIVGVAFFGEWDWRGVIWEPPTGEQFDLNDLVPPRSVKVRSARDINEHGQIAGDARNKKTGANMGVILSPVTPEMSLSGPVPGLADEVNTWTIVGADPGATVTFVYGTRGGGTYVPRCDALDAAIQIKGPKIMGTATADGNGNATIQLFVPPAASGAGLILFQAVDQQHCEESQLTTFDFE